MAWLIQHNYPKGSDQWQAAGDYGSLPSALEYMHLHGYRYWHVHVGTVEQMELRCIHNKHLFRIINQEGSDGAALPHPAPPA